MFDWFKKNNDVFGFFLAASISAVTFTILWLLNEYVSTQFFPIPLFENSLLAIVSLGINMLPLNYFINYQAYKTGRGMMIWVFLFTAFIVYQYFGADVGLRKADEKIIF